MSFLKYLPVAGIVAATCLVVAACSSSGDGAVFSNVPDAASTPAPQTDAAKPDPPPRPITEQPKPENPDKAAVPELTSITPEKGTVGAVDTTIVVTGKAFAPRSVVQLEGAPLPTSYTSDTELSATIPTAKLAAAFRFKVTVTTAAPGGGTSADVVFAVENPKPELTQLSPLSALAGSGSTLLTVTGTSFVAGAKIRVGTSELATTVKSPTQLEGTIPQGLLTTSASIPVKVINPIPGGGTSTEIAFTVSNPNASVTALSPDSAGIDGAAFTLTVSGTGFVPGSTIVFNGAPLATTLIASDQVKATVPTTALAAPGEVPVAVQNPPAGGPLSAPIAFRVIYPVPLVTTIAPEDVPAGSAPTEITVKGSRFFATTFITFNDAPATTTVVDEKTLKATLTAAQLATASVIKMKVVNQTPGGGPSDAKDIPVENGKATITTVNPSSFPASSPDTLMTVFGTGFLPTSKIRVKAVEQPTTYIDGGHLTVTVAASVFTAGGTTFTVSVSNPPPGGGISNVVRPMVACDSAGVNVLVDTTTQPLILDFPNAPKVPRWAAQGGTCPNVPLFPIDQPSHYAIVQNVTTTDLAMSAWAQCPDDGKGDAFLTFYKTPAAPTTDDERKACTGVVSEGGTKHKSPESGGSGFCPGLMKANQAALTLKACERAVVQIQTFRVEDTNYSSPSHLKIKGETP